MNKLSKIDQQLYSCLNLNSPKSFFLFAGAGTGKTRSLVNVLKKFKEKRIHKLRNVGRKVAIITYTNAACEEISRRLDFDSAFHVSTIHSFSWELIKYYTYDIKEWVRINTQDELEELKIKEKKGRSGSKASRDRKRKIKSKTKRLDNLESINKFTYNPNGTNSNRNSLNHSEVISITSEFLDSKKLLQEVMIRKFPILLIDESQDTNASLIESFFKVQSEFSSTFSLGLFGDTMQRIYMDGKKDLGENLSDEWVKPQKNINYRSPKRIIQLINKIRGDHPQEPSKNAEEGTVRLFIVNSGFDSDKKLKEAEIRKKMVEETGDELWGLDENVKILTLEHHMAASRNGFLNFFQPLYSMSSDSTPLLDGTLSGVPFIKEQLIPIYFSLKDKDEFKLTMLMKKYSPILSSESLKNKQKSIELLEKAQNSVYEFYQLWANSQNPKLIEVFKKIYALDLLEIPEVIEPIVLRNIEDEEISNKAKVNNNDTSEEEDIKDELIDAWEEALESNFSEAFNYTQYISGDSSFDTHQGIKGLEFPRVQVILDDEEARGFLFSYEKLLGAKEASRTDKKNEEEGKETTYNRTQRLFYVTCSRAEESLCVTAYTKNPSELRGYVISSELFNPEEIIIS